MNKTLLFLLLPGLLISCKPTPPSGDNGEIVPLTSECLLKNSDLYMKYPYKIKVQDSIMCIWDLHGGDRFYHLYSYPELQFITSFAVNGPRAGRIYFDRRILYGRATYLCFRH